MNQQLLDVAIAELPGVISWLKSAFAKAHPDQPQPTSEEVIAAYQAAYTQSLAIDDAILAQHRPPQP